jgi:hypothetical protein
VPDHVLFDIDRGKIATQTRVALAKERQKTGFTIALKTAKAQRLQDFQ